MQTEIGNTASRVSPNAPPTTTPLTPAPPTTAPLTEPAGRRTPPLRTGSRSAARAVLLGVAGMCLVGGSVGISRELTSAPLFTAQALRYALAGLVLFCVARAAHVPLTRPRGREWFWVTGIATFGLVLFNVAVVRGVAHAEPAVIAVAVACVPIVFAPAGPLIEHRAPHARVVAAAIAVTAGSALVEGTGRADAAGIGWAALTLVCEASFTLLAVPVLPRHGAWGVSLHSVWIGSLLLAVLGLVTEGPSATGRITAPQWAALGYLAIMVTAVAFILWYSAVQRLGAGSVGLLTGAAPISAAVTGMATGGRVPGLLVWCGMLIVIAGLAVGLLPTARPAPRSGRGQ